MSNVKKGIAPGDGGVKMTGKVHVELTGAMSISRDFDVEKCSIYMPLDNAYFLNIAPDEVLDKGAIVLPKYKGAGTYAYDAVASKPTYPNFEYHFVDLRLREGPQLVEHGQARVTFTVDNQGTHGVAELQDYTTETGGSVSGAITWTCDAVEGVSV
jgi:hypothetical protein